MTKDKNLSDPEVIKVSQQLDRLLNLFYTTK
ncbi:aspartyl-phosphate phosphatase Spo0E family protein [Brevibacillus fulvus]